MQGVPPSFAMRRSPTRYLLLTLAFACGGRQIPVELVPGAAKRETSALTTSGAHGGEAAAKDSEARPSLVVVGLRESQRKIEIVSHSPDDSWRSLNDYAPCDSCTADLTTVPSVLVHTTLRCAREDGRRQVVARDLGMLDVNYRPVTTIHAQARPRPCELAVVVEDRARDVEDETTFCLQPGAPIEDAAMGHCDFAEVSIPTALEVGLLTASFRGEERGATSIVLADGDQAPEPPQLRATLDLVYGPSPQVADIKAEAICWGQADERWSARVDTSVTGGIPGDAGTLRLRFDLRGEDVRIDTCHLLLEERARASGQGRELAVFCLESPAHQLRARDKSARKESARTGDRTSEVASALRSLETELALSGMSSSSSVTPFAARRGTCDE